MESRHGPPDGTARPLVAGHIYDKQGRAPMPLQPNSTARSRFQPQGSVKSNRARYGRNPMCGRRKGIWMRCKLEPVVPEALYAQADSKRRWRLSGRVGDKIPRPPGERGGPTFAMGRRGIRYLRLGKTEIARKDLTDARSAATDPTGSKSVLRQGGGQGSRWIGPRRLQCRPSNRPDTWAFLERGSCFCGRRFDAAIAIKPGIANRPSEAASLMAAD